MAATTPPTGSAAANALAYLTDGHTLTDTERTCDAVCSWCYTEHPAPDDTRCAVCLAAFPRRS
jgi:hypothetical protein